MKNDLLASVFVHVAISGAILALLLLSSPQSEPPVKKIPIIVVNTESTVQASNSPSVVEPPPSPPPPQPPKKREVFGANQRALKSDEPGAVEVKTGNTLAKSPDNLELTDEDADALPIPQPEYMVSELPQVIQQAKINYPQTAREMGIEGRVVLNILIDEKGAVRQAEVVEGLLPELDEEALRAIQLYQFAPAKIDQQVVAVRIQFAIQFILEEG